jgi:uncharacterized protein
MITGNIQKQITDAMKARDELRLSTLRMLSSALHNAKIDKRRDLTEEEEMAIVGKEAKKRRDAIEAYEKLKDLKTEKQKTGASLEDRISREADELKILGEFLPEQMEESELSDLIDQVIKEIKPEGMRDMGKVIGLVKEKAGGTAEGARVAEMVKSKLT